MLIVDVDAGAGTEAAALAAALDATKGLAVANRPGGEPMALQSGPRGGCDDDPPEPWRV